jgi:hypothetical protein
MAGVGAGSLDGRTVGAYVHAMTDQEEWVPKISDFLKELAKGPENSAIRDEWDARDREKAMSDFGLIPTQMDIIRDALDSGNLDPVSDAIDQELGEEQSKVKPFLWVK